MCFEIQVETSQQQSLRKNIYKMQGITMTSQTAMWHVVGKEEAYELATITVCFNIQTKAGKHDSRGPLYITIHDHNSQDWTCLLYPIFYLVIFISLL